MSHINASVTLFPGIRKNTKGNTLVQLASGLIRLVSLLNYFPTSRNAVIKNDEVVFKVIVFCTLRTVEMIWCHMP